MPFGYLRVFGLCSFTSSIVGHFIDFFSGMLIRYKSWSSIFFACVSWPSHEVIVSVNFPMFVLVLIWDLGEEALAQVSCDLRLVRGEWSWAEGQNRPVFLPSWMPSGRKTWGHLGVYIMKYKGRNGKRNLLYEVWWHSVSWFLARAYRALNFCISGNYPFLLDFKKGVCCQPVLSCWALQAWLECSLAKVRAAIKKAKKTQNNRHREDSIHFLKL